MAEPLADERGTDIAHDSRLNSKAFGNGIAGFVLGIGADGTLDETRTMATAPIADGEDALLVACSFCR